MQSAAGGRRAGVPFAVCDDVNRDGFYFWSAWRKSDCAKAGTDQPLLAAADNRLDNALYVVIRYKTCQALIYWGQMMLNIVR